ncbi:hypothetical protein ACIRYZ_18245 [Kitasatospora sp. NPDC101155]|uniref:hypothetical protein n=1 Tax=Kitasatospora sp. NPDC101155 TaxID=3364097 RepID=UPI003822C7C2
MESVRRRVARSRLIFQLLFDELALARLAVTLFRKGQIVGLCAAVLFLQVPVACMIAAESGDSNSGQSQLALGGCLLVAPVVWVLMCRRRGYSGRNPISALGHACLAQLRTDLPPDASQARRVALGGFGAMTQARLREAVAGPAPEESAWWWPGALHEQTQVHRLTAASAHPGDVEDEDVEE